MEEVDVVLNLEGLFYQEKIRPEITLLVQGTPVRFLCDSGASRTAMQEIAKIAKLV